MKNVTVKSKFHVRRQAKGRKQIKAGAAPSVGEGVPRISRLIALAIHFDGLVRDGVVADFAELARLGRVTRARLSQIMNLLNLAPDIQEDVLFRERRLGRERMTERTIRPIVSESNWRKQRRMWKSLRRSET